MRWTRLLVRGLPEPTAADRLAEIASDLWEQRAADRHSEAWLAASILLRAVRGVPADLLWRRAVGAATTPKTATTWGDPPGGTIMTKKKAPVAKTWAHLTGVEKLFDQTNGAVDFDTPDQHDATNVEADILAKGVASNGVTAGFFGGGL